MINNTFKVLKIFTYCFLTTSSIYTNEPTTHWFGELIIDAYSIPESSSRRGCLASSETFFTMSSPSNTQCFIYNRKMNYQAHCARNNHFNQEDRIAATIIADSKLITAQKYSDGLRIDTLDHNSNAHHSRLPQCINISSTDTIEQLSNLPNNLTSLLVSISMGKHILIDLHEEKTTRISSNVYVAHVIPDRTGNGIWYRTLEKNDRILPDGSYDYNNCIGHYDIRSGKTTVLAMLPNGIKEMNINRTGDRCIVTTWNHQHLVFDVGPSFKGLISVKQLNSPSNHTFMINDNTVVYNNSAFQGEQRLNWYPLEKDVTTTSILSQVTDQTEYVENNQLLVGYEGNSRVKVYEFCAQ